MSGKDETGGRHIGETVADFASFEKTVSILFTPASLLLLAEASALAAKAERDSDRLAVILAHAACDVQTEHSLSELLLKNDVPRLSEALLKAIGPQVSLHVEKTLGIFTALSGDNPRQRPWWDDWKRSLKRRNTVAHGGRLVPPEEVLETVELCRKYVEHVRQVVDATEDRFGAGPGLIPE